MLETLERLILDPVTEAPPYQVAANRPVEVTGVRAPSPEGHGVFLSDHQYPRPEATATYASSRDSQGEARFGKPKLGNRKIPVKVYVSEATGVGAATNLAPNPGGEVLKKWVDGPDYPVVRELGGTNGIPSLSGEFRDKHSFDGSASDSNMGSLERTMPAAGTYTFSVFVWVPSNWDGSAPILALEGWVGGTVEKQGQADLTKRDQWQRVVSTVKVVAGDLIGFVLFRAATPPKSPATGIAYTDALQIESGTAATAYLCGDTPGCYWNGTPNLSTSTRVGSGVDRKRFLRCLYDLQEKIEKLSEEGGTLKRILPDGSWMVFDVVEATFVGNWEKRFNQGQEEFSFELICRPGARLAPLTFLSHEEKTLPILKFTELDVPGNLPALGDLLIEDTQGVNREFVAVSVASRFLDQTANGDVFYEAESRQRLSSAALAAGSGIPSGSEANKVVSTALFEDFTPFLSTRSSAGAYTTHIGAQKLFARVFIPTANVGTVSLRLEYAQGDLLRWKILPTIVIDSTVKRGVWVLLELGTIRLKRTIIGPQRWEGRLVAKSSTIGDTLQVDWLAILPVEEFYGEVQGLTVPPSAGLLVARDNFEQTAGALTGKSATVGGAWSSLGGDADDIFVSGTPGFFPSNYAYRTPAGLDVSGAHNDPPTPEGTATGRFLRLGTGKLAGVSVQADMAIYGSFGIVERWGVMARIVDINNLVLGRLYQIPLSGGGYSWGLSVHKRVAGVWTQLGSSLAYFYKSWNPYTPVVTIAPDGSGSLVVKSGSSLAYTMFTWGADAQLATAGVLATGGYGIFNVRPDNPYWPGEGGGGSELGVIDNFIVREVTEQPLDSAIYANRDLRVRWDKTLREAADGSGAFSEVGVYSGDRLLIPHSGREGRPVRVAVLASRGLPKTGEDPQADDLKGTLTLTPRVTEVPEPA